MSIAISLHMLAAVVWVGGMFFAYMALRPAAASLLEPAQRLSVWNGSFARFFPWVWLCVVVLLLSGYYIIFAVYGGGMASARVYVHIMNTLGIVMMLIFMHVYFAPYRRLRRAVEAQDWATGGKYLGQIRRLIGINLILGIITVVIASGGRVWV